MKAMQTSRASGIRGQAFRPRGPAAVAPGAGAGGKRLARQGGFSLVEVMIATAVIGVSVFALYSGIVVGMTLMHLTRENFRANQILQERMEMIRLLSWRELKQPGCVPQNFTVPFRAAGFGTNNVFQYQGSILITNAPLIESYSNALVMVTVSVSWTSADKPRTRSLTTLVSQDGQQHVSY